MKKKKHYSYESESESESESMSYRGLLSDQRRFKVDAISNIYKHMHMFLSGSRKVAVRVVTFVGGFLEGGVHGR